MEQSDGASAPTIEQQIEELKAAGWKAQTPKVWGSPTGALYLGPDGAWKIMRKRVDLPATYPTTTDTDRLNWIEKFIETGCLESCFELDAGIHVFLHPLGGKSIEIRERNTFREAIDEAMKRK